VLLAVVGILYLLSNTYLPTLRDVYVQLGAAELPTMTQFFFDLGSLLEGRSGLIVGVAILLFALVLFLPQVREAHYRLLLRLPGLSILVNLSDTSAVMRTLGSMLARGVPMSDALRTAKLTVWSTDYRRALERMAVEADRGKPTAPLLTPQAPPTAAWLFAEAEQRGNLPEACNGIATYCEEWFDRMSIRSVAVLEPMLIVFLGVLVGGIIISGYLPLFYIPRIMGR